jgi:hypothetical protein
LACVNNEIAKFSPQLQVKLSLKAELALISVNPATHPKPQLVLSYSFEQAFANFQFLGPETENMGKRNNMESPNFQMIFLNSGKTFSMSKS